MNILNKIVDKGIIVGYVVQDDKFALPLCKDALYCEMYITSLIADGYKYYNHNADEIEDKNGTPISMLPERELSEFDEMEWFAGQDLASTSMLSDVEAAQYYTYREEAAVKFKTEASYEINTRDEFISYLEQLKNAFYSVGYSTDNRPLNAFVNPEALFTLDELIDNSEYCKYFDIIVKRHHMRDYKTYQNLINWLVDKGVLTNPNPSMAEFLSAYYAWGPEGINSKCVKVETKISVDGVFSFSKDPLSSSSPESYVHDNREGKVSVMDGQERLHFLKSHEDISQISDIKDFGRSRIVVNSNNSLLLMRRMTNIGKKYVPVDHTSYSDVSDRLYITIITESGFTYTYKVSHNKLRIGLAHSNNSGVIYYSTDNFNLCSIVQSVSIPLDMVSSKTDYYLWNLAILKSAQIMKDKSHPVPVNSTSEYLINEGLNPVAVISLMSKAVSVNKQYRSNQKYQMNYSENILTDALDLYLEELPDYLLSAFNLTPEDLEDGVVSFLELADVDDLRDRRDAMMEQKIGPGDPGFDETFKDYKTKYGKDQAILSDVMAVAGITKKQIDAIDYYTKLKFVYDCLHGEISIDNFGDGKIADLGASFRIAAECILSVIYAEYGNDVSEEVAENAILHIEDSDLIDTSRIFRTRDRALKGYLTDFAAYRKTRGCDDTWLWAYCTKVFREISNLPIEKQRPYLMEMVVLENSKPDIITRQLMTEIARVAIEEAGLSTELYDEEGGPLYGNSDKYCALKSTEYIGAQLFFYILAGGVKTEPVDGNYIISIDMRDAEKLQVKVPTGVYDFIKQFDIESHRKYITVYDYCKYEYNPVAEGLANPNRNAGRFNFCLVNASVDPWHVKPKSGYTIKSYSLLPNYYDQASLDGANGEGFYESNYNTGAISVQPLKTLYKTKFVLADGTDDLYSMQNIVRSTEDPDDLLEFLEESQTEHIFTYVRRWALERKRAAENGKKLLSIPLKQDLVYASLAIDYCDEVPSITPVYTDDLSVNDKACQQVTTVNRVSWRDYANSSNLIEGKQVRVSEFAVHDLSINEMMNVRDILDGSYESELRITITGNYINVMGDSLMRVPVSRLSAEDIDVFVADSVLRKIGDNKYFIRAINGDFVLEV